MKISSKHIVHKAKIGGTIVNINNLKDAEQAFDKLSKIDNFEGILVQEMIIGEELIIGLKHTPEFNSVVMMGRGGGEVEKIRDISFRVCPITGEIAREMLREIKFYKTIKDKVNIKSIEKTLLKISNLSQKYKEILELDINPLIVNKKEAVAVDARILTNTL
jgi:succinyl-CoA synthetase beta subunit